jgi:photosystem II stability/assembly factor-like uncharacterized protein
MSSLNCGFCFRLHAGRQATRYVYWRLCILFSCVLLTGCMTLNAAAPPLDSASAETTDGGLWRQVRQMQPAHSVAMVGFLDGDRGLTVGCQGVVFHTADGGATWQRANSRGECLWGMDVVDEQVAWSVGNAGQVGLSTDGWQNWEISRISGYDCHFASFVDARSGWVVSAGAKRLWATTDGAQTWTQVKLPPKIQVIVDVALRTPTDGYLLDRVGTLYVTQDGGQSWTSRSLGLGKGAIPRYAHTAAIRFFDAERGIIVLNLQRSGRAFVVAMRTADGGQTWEQEPVPARPGYLYLARDGRTLAVIEDDKSYQAGFNTSRSVAVFRYQESLQ